MASIIWHATCPGAACSTLVKFKFNNLFIQFNSSDLETNYAPSIIPYASLIIYYILL